MSFSFFIKPQFLEKSGAKQPFISDSIRTGQGHGDALGKSPVRAASKSFVVEVIAANGLLDIAPDHLFFNTKAGDPQKPDDFPARKGFFHMGGCNLVSNRICPP